MVIQPSFFVSIIIIDIFLTKDESNPLITSF